MPWLEDRATGSAGHVQAAGSSETQDLLGRRLPPGRPNAISAQRPGLCAARHVESMPESLSCWGASASVNLREKTCTAGYRLPDNGFVTAASGSASYRG